MKHAPGHAFDYIPGGAWGTCPRCTFDTRLSDMRLDWTGARVCVQCWDPRPDTMTPPVVFPEGLPRPDAQPELPDAFIATPVRPEDL